MFMEPLVHIDSSENVFVTISKFLFIVSLNITLNVGIFFLFSPFSFYDCICVPPRKELLF